MNTTYVYMYIESSAQSCPSFCNAIDYSPPGSSDHGIFQARILECVAVCVCVCVCVCVYIYIYTHTHIYIYEYNR